MPLSTGTRLGSYEVVAQIGAGGMGEVYQARDSKLGRDVAIKVLPSAFINDPERLARFQREARMLAALNHPNIATIHGFENFDGTHFLIMELVHGENLAERINREGPVPVEEALKIAVQIAESVEAAHEKGIIHRDLKPANVKVTPQGRVKILDFGLAKALAADVVTSDPSESTTLSQAATIQGVILGTPAYMSPEQARGKLVDKRTDVWAFGCLLYELLAGKQAFGGETVSDTLIQVLERDPDWRVLPPATPAKIRDLLRRCLQKDRQSRLRDLGDARIEIEETLIPRPAAAQVTPKSARLRWVAATSAVVFVVALAVSDWLFFSRKPRALTRKDTIVLSDFTNTTGDTVFDGTLRQGLSAQLEQSPFLNLLSDERIAQTLSLMAQPKGTQLTHELAKQVCQRTASAAVLDGSIAEIGTAYLLTLHAVNCSNGGSLASTQAQASDKNHVLEALGKMASEIRAKLGESLGSVQRYDAPPENVTTPSLEALKAYGLGYEEANIKNDYAAATRLFQRAISLDPNFAMAYARLGSSYFNLADTSLAAETTRKAYQLRERVSEREKFYISSHYEQFVLGNLEETRKTYELWAQTYPGDDVPVGNLGLIYANLGNYEKSLAATQEALRLDPGNALYNGNLVSIFLTLNRTSEAKRMVEQAQARGLDSPSLHTALYLSDLVQHDAADLERQAAELIGKPGYEDLALYYDSDAAAYSGQLAKARELTRRAAESARRADEREAAADYEAEAAVREALVDNVHLAKRQAQAALALSNGRDLQAISAIALGLSGDSVQATRLADNLGKRFPEDTVVQFNYLPTIRAAVSLRGGDTGKAIQALAAAEPYELGATTDNLSFYLYPVYMRGEAYLAAHQGTAAAAEFEKIIDHPGLVVNELIGALARLEMGRSYELSGDSIKAKAAYKDFLTLWKYADPNTPILKQAKAEHAKLQ